MNRTTTDIRYIIIATEKESGVRGFVQLGEGGYPYFSQDFNPSFLLGSRSTATEDVSVVIKFFSDKFVDVTAVQLVTNYIFTDTGNLNISTETNMNLKYNDTNNY